MKSVELETPSHSTLESSLSTQLEVDWQEYSLLISYIQAFPHRSFRGWKPLCHKDSAKVGNAPFRCPELVLYGLRELA